MRAECCSLLVAQKKFPQKITQLKRKRKFTLAQTGQMGGNFTHPVVHPGHTTTPMKISTAQVHETVQRYVEAIASQASPSPSLTDQRCNTSNHDGRLVRLLELRGHGNPLRHCTRRQKLMLIHHVCGRTWEPVGIVAGVNGGYIETDRRSRPITHLDLARMFHLTARQVRRELERARRAVRQALEENWQGSARNSKAS